MGLLATVWVLLHRENVDTRTPEVSLSQTPLLLGQSCNKELKRCHLETFEESKVSLVRE